MVEKWIWLDENKYPSSQTTVYSGFQRDEKEKYGNYTVAEFSKKYEYNKTVSKIKVRVSGDTEFCLFINGKAAVTGPVSVGGDFLFNDTPRPSHYSTEFMYEINSNTVDFFARVKMMPVGICEYSKGHGGFMLSAEVFFEDGSKTYINTDNSWLSRKNGRYVSPYIYDGRIKPDEYTNAAEINNIWQTKNAPIPPRTEEIIKPVNGGTVSLFANEEKEIVLEFDKIYASILLFESKTNGYIELDVKCFETTEDGTEEKIILSGNETYRGLQLHSAGALRIKAVNKSDEKSEFTASIINTFYPVYSCAETVTSDKELNCVLSVCAHTLKQCRQMIHLDSPRHGEPLACTGDYYIESLMTAFSYGDQSLSEFDILRTAELLRYHDGRMFHTTYSLIWVQMLYDNFMLTGNKDILTQCFDALIMLYERFKSYIGENGLIETPPDYMFIDWIYIDGISLHHPPKALGQTCLNIYFFGMLETAAKIFDVLGENTLKQQALCDAENIKNAVNSLLFDKEKCLYFEGLNTPTPDNLLYHYMPQNVSKRYYRKHANILAACFGICEKDVAKKLIKEAVLNDELGDYQPYFAHFLLEAIYRNGLRDDYTLKILERWKAPVKECSKGLVEGFIAPEPTYSFDHSHAWGGTPLYSLPKALSGIEIIEAGYKKISLSPSLLGLESADVQIPTPFGNIELKLRKGEKCEYVIPDRIEVI